VSRRRRERVQAAALDAAAPLGVGAVSNAGVIVVH
jgi:hypothetical protein